MKVAPGEPAEVEAPLIRATLSRLRRRKLSNGLSALVTAMRGVRSSEALEREWDLAIRGLRVTFYASPIGTERHRLLLQGLAANARLVRGMRAVLRKIRGLPYIVWCAVLAAEGSAASRRVLAMHLRRMTVEVRAHYQRALDRLSP